MNDNEIMQQYKKYEPFFGSWYLKRFIGEGSFAKVFEIVRNDFGSEYSSALKIITVSKTKTEIDAMKSEGMSEQEIRESLKAVVEDTVREIQLMYQLRGNGNIVGYEDHSVMEHEDGLGWDIFIKMEFLTSLNSYIESGEGKLSRRDIVKLGADICKALETCQKFNITHRDIKSDNIFISGTGDFKLGDFGIARIIERKDTELSRKGTSAYMAPEVYKGQSYTSAVDIYSLGIVLYRLLNHNRGPFLPEYPKPISLDERDRALVMRMSGERFPKPTQAGEGKLGDIVLKACAYRPEERYSSPVFMRQELEAILYDGTETGNDELLAVAEESDRSMAAAVEEKAKEAMAGEYEATEVLREESTPLGAIPVVPGEAEVKILCKKCGNAINRDSAFCPICGASQREKGKAAPMRKMPKEKAVPVQKMPKEMAKPAPVQSMPEEKVKPAPMQSMPKERPEGKNPKKLMTIWKTPKAPIIGGICAVILAIVVIIGVSGNGSSSDNGKDKTNTGALVSNESMVPAPAQNSNREQDDRPWVDNVLMAVEEPADNPSDNDVFGSKVIRANVLTITFLDSLDDMYINAWDVSADGSGKVMAWASRREDGYYDLYIGGEGGVAANKDSSHLFNKFVNLQQIQMIENFHTENVEDMSYMFCDCNDLLSLDVSSFDTSNVTDMSHMFDFCSDLTRLDVSGFDTSNVTDMNHMFFQCRSLTSLDVGSFDTSNVMDMSYMFCVCSSLTNLNVSGFDTSNVTDTSDMFSKCKSLTGVDVSNFSLELVEKMGLSSGNTAGSQTSQPAQDSPSPSPKPAESSPLPSPSQQPSQPSPSPSPQPSQPAPSQNPEPSGPPPGGSGEERPDRPPQPT